MTVTLLPLLHHDTVYNVNILGILESILISWKIEFSISRSYNEYVDLQPILLSYEASQYNRVCGLRSFMCSLFPRASFKNFILWRIMQNFDIFMSLSSV